MLKAWRRLFVFPTDIENCSLENPQMLIKPEGWVAVSLAEDLSPDTLLIDPRSPTVPSSVYRFQRSLERLLGAESVTADLLNRFRQVALLTYYMNHDVNLTPAAAAHALRDFMDISGKEINSSRYHTLAAEMPRSLAVAAVYSSERLTQLGVPKSIMTAALKTRSGESTGSEVLERGRGRGFGQRGGPPGRGRGRGRH